MIIIIKIIIIIIIIYISNNNNNNNIYLLYKIGQLIQLTFGMSSCVVCADYAYLRHAFVVSASSLALALSIL